MREDPATAAPDAGSSPGLGRRLGALLERLPAATRAALEERLSPESGLLDAAAARRDPAFAWIALPRWLARQLPVAGGRRPAPALVEELLWGQLLVFLHFRLQDDLLDGAGASPATALAAQRLMTEALAAFERCGGPALTALARERIDGTLDAILELDALQGASERDGERELDAYVRQSGCLRIACDGLLLLADQPAPVRRRVAGALDRLFLAAQLLDDLEDVEEDLERGRINHAAWLLARPVFGRTPEAIGAVVASNLVVTDRLERLLERVASELERAARELAGLTPAGAGALAEYARCVRDSKRRRRDRLAAA